MPEINTNTAMQPLTALLEAEQNFPGYALDICSGYISTNGILPLKRMLQKAPKVRAVVGLNPTNKLSAFQMLHYDYGVELYVYITAIGHLFHPKVYLGTLDAQAWVMVGSSNLTHNGLSANIEQNLFVTGQRHIEPFVSIETQIAAFRQQAYLFGTTLEKQLKEIEDRLGKYPQEIDYKRQLFASGIRPKTLVEQVIPIEAQQIALTTLFDFVNNTHLEYAYQMLLLLVILDKTDQNGVISIDEAAYYFIDFYRQRRESGLSGEKRYGSKRAAMDNPIITLAKARQTIKDNPFPRFERQGLLYLSEDEKYFVVNPVLMEAMTEEVKAKLKQIGISRLKTHFYD